MIDETNKEVWFYEDEDYRCTFYDREEYKTFVNERYRILSVKRLEFVEPKGTLGNSEGWANYDI